MRKLIILLLFLSIYSLHASEIQITNREIAVSSKLEYNRNFYFYGESDVKGAVELNNRLIFDGGFSLGLSKYEGDINIFTGAQFYPAIPVIDGLFSVKLSYIYNGLPDYKAHAHTILPVISFNGKWAGISIGPGFHFTSFFRDSAVYEPILSFSGYINFINNEILRIGMTAANFDDFYAGPMGSYSLGFLCNVKFSRQWSMFNELKLMQSGSIALSAAFYGVSCRGGFKYSW